MERIYLVPGFFGFTNLGDLRYFGHVADYLGHAGPWATHVVPTPPTAALPRRALALHACVAETSAPGDTVFVVGHSSGGLDARLWASPGVKLPDGVDPEPLARQLRAVVTVSTPHFGTPSAELFTSVSGKRLLRLLSLMTVVVVRHGGTPLQAMLTVGDWFKGADRMLQTNPDVLDELFHTLLAELSPERRVDLESFFRDVGTDQGLLPQLMPDAMQVFDAATGDRPGVRYGCVITKARRPGLDSARALGMSPVAQSAFAMFSMCWRAARLSTEPNLDPGLHAALRKRWPDLLPRDNDGMVPTLSQARGELVRAVDGDHLDALGHFGDPTLTPPSYDWFNTGTGFDREQFEATWTDVAHFLEDSR